MSATRASAASRDALTRAALVSRVNPLNRFHESDNRADQLGLSALKSDPEYDRE